MTRPDQNTPIRPSAASLQGELGKSYEPKTFEKDVYEYWESHGCFAATDTPAPGQKSFCIVIPPPNVTGVLHMGHALTNTIQDILTRWRRMHGDNALWLPGTDHAGIATQAQVEKQIAKEGKGPSGKPLTRHDLGREAFLKRTWQWKEDHGTAIVNQLRRMGSSLDWERERFTMDEGFSHAVRTVFVRLYQEGLIYRGERIINWCPRCQTALSDLEVVPTDRKGSLWHILYPIVNQDGSPVSGPDGKPAHLEIATTRPETLLGDTAVAIHPEDDRYAHVRGKFAKLPLLGRLIPVIQDAYVDREFGTGGLKVTPAHDFNDYDLGKRHGLPIISVMGKDGKITADGGKYAGLKFEDARQQVVQDLKDAGQLVKVEDHPMKIGLCQRCDRVAEPVVSEQWFVKIEPLAKPAIAAVQTGKIEFSPKNWEKTYFEWMNNIRDWCISRQLWWGHQIPAWYCGRCQEITVAESDPTKCGACSAPASELKRDEDVLDTWFSSGLWPFGTLGWPEKTAALKTFYPTAILETGFDIIFFWVARMIMMGIHFMGEVPFRKVYLHAMVRDEKGEKMSKSKGNVIDPLVVIDEHGADPLRFTFAIMAGQGRDIKLSLDRVAGYRAFCNKLWNATKFMHLYWKPLDEPSGGAGAWLQAKHADLTLPNRWILSRLQVVTNTVEQGLGAFELNVASQSLYDFAWGEFCDWFIEFSKPTLANEQADPAVREQTLITMHFVLDSLLRLLHPFIPFVTETLWQSLPWKQPGVKISDGKTKIQTLMLQPFPKPNERLRDTEAERSVEALRAVIDSIRNFRGENNISPKVEFVVRYRATRPAAEDFLKLHQDTIETLARAKFEKVVSDQPRPMESVIPISTPPLELRIDLEGLVNVDEEKKRLEKEIERVNDDLQHVRRKLANPAFVDKAPAELVNQERAKEQTFAAKVAELETGLQRLRQVGSKK
ncbi:MAG: valine--tRNA ligase [Bacteriovoracia bacterium]